MLRRKVIACALALGFLLLPAAMAPAQEQQVVETQDNVFSPAEITVGVGDTIEFRNTGKAPHTATADDRSFDTGNLNAGQSKTITFSKAGSFNYNCIYHEALGMVGTIVVNAAGATASPTPSPSSSPAQAPASDASTAAPESPAPQALASPGRAEYAPLIFGVVGLVAAAGLALSGLMNSKERR
jgi:plastocyanin